MSEARNSVPVEDEMGFGVAGVSILVLFCSVAAVGQVMTCLLWAVASMLGFSPLDQE